MQSYTYTEFVIKVVVTSKQRLIAAAANSIYIHFITPFKSDILKVTGRSILPG